MLFIDGNVVVNNNNFQGITVISGTVNLTAGEHNIVIAYYQGGGGYGLYADVQIPGGSSRAPARFTAQRDRAQQRAIRLVVRGWHTRTRLQRTHSSAAMGIRRPSRASLSGTGNVTKVGAGTLILGQPQYTGTTTISAGTLQIGDGVDPLSVLPTSSIVDNGALVFDTPTGNQLTYAQTISGSGSLTVIGGGTLYLDGDEHLPGPDTHRRRHRRRAQQLRPRRTTAPSRSIRAPP